uniref:Uncharacterized protein n=1 Tax=Salmo trutta TaxID=8032 RepID=A0A673ZWJ0_SALTR
MGSVRLRWGLSVGLGLGWGLSVGLELGWGLSVGLGLGWGLSVGLGLGWGLSVGLGLGWGLSVGLGWAGPHTRNYTHTHPPSTHTLSILPMKGGAMPRQWPQKSGQQSETVRLQNSCMPTWQRFHSHGHSEL